MFSSRCSLQQAFEAYDRQLLLEKQQEAIELEHKRQKQLEQEQSQRNYENGFRITNWDIEYEPQESYGSTQEDLYHERDGRSSGSGSFLRGVAATAIGASIANRGIKKELEIQRKEEQAREKSRTEEDDRRKREAAHRSQVEWREIDRINKERRRKGLPELPYPERFYW